MAMDTRLLKRIESFYYSIKDKAYWISYQAKDTISETFPHILYGSGYECKLISESIMPLFLKLYRSKFSSQFFNLILFERKFCCPCLIYKDIHTNKNSITFNEKDSSIIISYKNHKLLDSFWEKTLDSYDIRSIVEDFYDLLDNILDISHVLPKSDLDSSNVENSFNLIIDKTLTSHLKVEGNLRDYGFSNDQVLELFIGSFLYPWQSFIYQDLSDILGEYNTIQGGLTICYRSIYDNLSQIKTEYKSEIYELQHIILAKIWELNLLHRQDNALKSAKAAIMSRNMSHNLGSHVMFYIKQKLQSVSKIVDSKVLDNIIPGKIPDIAAVEAAIKANKGIELPFLVGLGRFINYLQERQDYIATIATDYIPANSTISFKDFIYDELKPELRYQRHHSNSDDAGWKSGNLLLDYIAYSEGYRSCNKIEILFGEFNGSSPVKDTNPDKDFQKLREFNIAVPGGVIGRQALFSIFENIIRNAAKHSERRSDNKLVLQLSLLEKDSVLFTEDEFRAKRNDDKVYYDKCGLDLKKLYANYFDRYHFLRIKVDMPNPDGVIDTLVDNFADPYIDDNGAMKETTKGLKEMRISAAWLRGKSIDTEIPADEPPAISIYSEPYKGDESKVTISYILCIPKPCRVAFVLNIADFETLNIAEFNQSKNLNKLANLNKLFSPYGCKVFNQEQLSDDKVIEEIANYEIVCMSENDKDICSRISSRYIIDDVTNENQLKKNDLLTNLINSIENTDYTNEKNKKDAIEDSIGSVYDTWFKITYNDVTPKLVVADGKAVQNNKRENGHLSSDSNVILTTTGKVGDEDNASTQNSENANDASVTLSERIVTKDDVKGAVVYSTHFKGLSSKSEGPDGYNTWLQDAICIESVTGNNSTARLIRQDEWTKEWKTKILSAGMARVAIFDERIFSSFVSRESKAKIDDVLSQINTIKSEANKDSWKDKFIELGIQPRHAKKLETANADETRKIIEKTYRVEYQYDVAQKNHERRIWAFDIKVPEKVNNTVEIVGYNVCLDDCVGEYKEHKSDAIISIAKISYNEESKIFEVTLCDDKMVFTKGNSNIFDYITIHQGVLDKIYTAFGIKDNAIEKHKVTHALHSCFSKHVTPGDKKAFLPNFIIHSGRSKPSAADMPQHQPFVQFAAVDHAVKDCKYTLVELLATAHYEKGNNNN